MKVDIKRLHEVHKHYPNTSRKMGKTTYCHDSLLRGAQTGVYKQLCYVTNTQRASEQSFNDFTEFLDNAEEEYKISSEGIISLYDSKIIFSSPDRQLKGRADGYIEDYFQEYAETPQYKLDEIEEWSKRQLTRRVYL